MAISKYATLRFQNGSVNVLQPNSNGDRGSDALRHDTVVLELVDSAAEQPHRRGSNSEPEFVQRCPIRRDDGRPDSGAS